MADTPKDGGPMGPLTAGTPTPDTEAKAEPDRLPLIAEKAEPKSTAKSEPAAVYTFLGPPESTIRLSEDGEVYKPGDVLPISRAQAVSLAGEASLQIDGPDLPKQGEGQSAAFEGIPAAAARAQGHGRP